MGGAPVPHYFFHFKIEDRLYVDDDGAELPDLSHAHAFAQNFVRGIRERSNELGTNWSRYAIEVADSTGRSILIVPFAMVHAKSGLQTRIGFQR